jgi:hypothetical protein
MLVYEVYFSVWGEDQTGQPMAVPGPGGLRFLQVTRPLILPSCALIPPLLDLPVCELKHKMLAQADQADTRSGSGGKDNCPTCGNAPSSTEICTSCPTGIVPHPRHDKAVLPAVAKARNLTPNEDCLTCIHSDMAWRSASGNCGPKEWKLCACGLDAGNIALRMKSFATEGIRADGSTSEQRWREVKEVEERGQSRSRNRAGQVQREERDNP